MNLNGNISFRVPTAGDLKRILPVLKRFESVLIGLALIAVLGYTALIVQKAINVSGDAAIPHHSISFDRTTLESLKGRVQIDGSTSTGTLGTASPFGN